MVSSRFIDSDSMIHKKYLGGKRLKWKNLLVFSQLHSKNKEALYFVTRKLFSIMEQRESRRLIFFYLFNHCETISRDLQCAGHYCRCWVFMMDKIITLPAPRILEKSARGRSPARHLIFLF